MPGTDVRAGDSDREQAVEELRRHLDAGRLTVEEFEERVSAAYGAERIGELNSLTGDLPVQPRLPPAEGARLWWPGAAAFHISRESPLPPADVYDAALRTIVPRMAMSRYELSVDDPARRLVFRDGSHTITLMLLPTHPGGTELVVFGHAPRSVRRAFATLQP